MALATNGTPGEVHLNGDIHTSNDAQLPELTPTGVKTGTYNFPHVVVDQKGRVLSIKEAVVGDVPCTTANSCGIVRIDDSIMVDIDGILDMYVAVTATPTGTPGIMQVGDGITVENGLISIQNNIATATETGVIQPGDYLAMEFYGVLYRTGLAGDATESSTGLVEIGENISVSGGIISANLATNTTFGLVDSNNVNNIEIISGEIDVGSNISLKSINQSYTAAQNSQMATITNAIGTIQLDASIYDVFHITTAGDLTIDNIINMSPHQQIDIIIELGNLISENALTLNPAFFKISGNQISGHTTLVTCMQITDGGDKAYTIVQPYMQ